MKHWLQYWKSSSADANKGEALWCACSSKYKVRSVTEGDVLWIVTVREGRLTLLGDILIEQLLPMNEFFGLYRDERVLQADYYAVGDRRGAVMQERDVHRLEKKLRFKGDVDRITSFGSRMGICLQPLRELTDDSVRLVRRFTVGPLQHFSKADSDDYLALKEFSEGEGKLVSHYRIERSAELVKSKKEEALTRAGELRCEVCNFHFQSYYGPLYGEYAQCHHVLPIARRGENYTASLSDVMLLCANCHAAAHRLPEAHSREHLMRLRAELAVAGRLHQ